MAYERCIQCEGLTRSGRRCRNKATCRKYKGARYCAIHIPIAKMRPIRKVKATPREMVPEPSAAASMVSEPPVAVVRKQRLVVSNSFPRPKEAYRKFRKLHALSKKMYPLRKEARGGGCGRGPWKKVGELSGGFVQAIKPMIVERALWKRRYVLKVEAMSYEAASKMDIMVRILDKYGLHAARIDAWHCDGHYYLVCEKLSKKFPKKVTAKEVGDVVDLFQRMHNLGIHHGDTHDGNMMYDRKGRLKCIDLDTRRTTDSLFLGDGFPTFGRWTKDQHYEILAEKCIEDYKLFIGAPRLRNKFCSKKFKRFRARLRTLLIAAGAEDIPGRLCDDDGLLEEIFEYA